METQKVKILDTATGDVVFFFDHSFKTAMQHAMEYIARNNKSKLEIDILSSKPKPFPKWELLRN